MSWFQLKANTRNRTSAPLIAANNSGYGRAATMRWRRVAMVIDVL